MSILDKKCYLTANISTSKIEGNTISFYNTDKNTSILYLKLKYVDDSNLDKYFTSTMLNDYTVKLAVVKPKTMELVEMSGIKENDMFKFELPTNFTDQVGKCICELIISTIDEKLTLDEFIYSVKESATTKFNAEIEPNPDLPILKQLIEQVRELINQVGSGGSGSGHVHSNKNILDTITEEKVSYWNGVINKVDKVEGKQLSTEDYTTADKQKLSNIDTSLLQPKTDNTLNTTNKTIVGAINELKSSSGSGSGGNVDLSAYQTKSDDALATTNKTVIGSINELYNDKLDKTKLNDNGTGTDELWSASKVNAQFNTIVRDVENIKNNGTVTDEQVNTAVDNYLTNNPIEIGDLWMNISDGEIFEVTLPQQTGITATFTQGSTVIYTTTLLDDLKSMLVVKKVYDDGTTETITSYTLSGTFVLGTSTITIINGTYTTTFTVTVSEEPGYVTSNLGVYYDFSQCENGYLTNFTDLSVKNVIPTVNYTNSDKSNNTIGINNGVLYSGLKVLGAYDCTCDFYIPFSTTLSYPYTIEAYMKTLYSGNVTIFSTRYNTSFENSNGLNIISQSTGNIAINGTYAQPNQVSDILPLTTDFTHIVVCVLADGTNEIYLNGVLEHKFTTATMVSASTQVLKIIGDYKMLRVYNKTLSSSEVTRNYNDVISTIGGAS